MHEQEQSHFHNCTASEVTEKKKKKKVVMSFIFYVTAEDITRLLRHRHLGGATANTSHLLLPSPQHSACLVQLRWDVVDWVKKESSMHNFANTPL